MKNLSKEKKIKLEIPPSFLLFQVSKIGNWISSIKILNWEFHQVFWVSTIFHYNQNKNTFQNSNIVKKLKIKQVKKTMRQNHPHSKKAFGSYEWVLW